MYRTILFSIITAAVSFAQSIQPPQIPFSPKEYICYRAAEPMIIDGKLDELSWQNAGWTDDFIDIEGDIKPSPRFRTQAKMLWDDNYFYISAVLYEPDIWGKLMNRDDVIFYDNDFEVFIDPDGDTHAYAEFEMNALNTVWDLLIVKPYRELSLSAINGWDIKGLKTAVSIDGTLNTPGDVDNSWTVEIAFPWPAFFEISGTQAPPAAGDQWRVNFSRVEWKTEVIDGQYQKIINPDTGKPFPEDNWVWSPQGIINMHYPEMWGYVQFSGLNSGSGKECFVKSEIEEHKWFLRQLYYKEKAYYEVNGKYTSDLSELGFSLEPPSGFLPPLIEIAMDFFQAVLTSADGSIEILIRSDSQTKITEKAK